MTDDTHKTAFTAIAARRAERLRKAAIAAKRQTNTRERIGDYVAVIQHMGKFTAEHIAVAVDVPIHEALDYLLSLDALCELGDGFYMVIPDELGKLDTG